MIYSQSFCRVYQARGNSQSLYLTETDYTSVRVLGQTFAIYFWQSEAHSHRKICYLLANRGSMRASLKTSKTLVYVSGGMAHFLMQRDSCVLSRDIRQVSM